MQALLLTLFNLEIAKPVYSAYIWLKQAHTTFFLYVNVFAH